jgi:hypothetical protein
LNAHVEAFIRWRDAPAGQREEILREQGSDNALIASLSTAYRDWRELDETQLQTKVAPNGKTCGDTTGAERFEMAEWAKGLVQAVRDRAVTFELLASATATHVKI